MFMKKIEKVNFEKKNQQMETNALQITKYANN